MKLVKISRLVGSFLPESKIKSALSHLFYKYVYSISVRKKRMKIGGITIKYYSNVFSINNKSEIKQYYKHYQPNKGDVIFDCGGFYGLCSIFYAKKIGKKGKVYTFEIDPLNIKILKKNVKLNKIDNIFLVNKGLWDKKDAHYLLSKGSSTNVIKNRGKHKVYLIKGDDFVREKNISRLDLIKMNIEGAEVEAIWGFKQTIKKLKPRLLIYADHIIGNKRTYKKIINFLNEHNYQIRLFDNFLIYGVPKK